jgi:ABC-type branched-subunit amino acid transport system substrate-binding protein
LHAIRRFVLALLLLVVLAACDTQAPAATGPSVPSSQEGPASVSPSTLDALKVAYVQDLAPEQALDTTLPPLQAIELAFATAASSGRTPAPVEVVAFDTQGDPASIGQIADEIASNPSFIAAVAAPNLHGLGGLVGILGPVGVPLLSLSASDPIRGAAPGTFFRFVAPLAVQASSLAHGVQALQRADGDVCLVVPSDEGARYSKAVRHALSPGSRVIEHAEGDETPMVPLSRCGIIVWTGSGVGGAALALSLEDAPPPSPILIGGPGLREPDFLGEAGTAAEGTVAFCSCADVSTALGLGAQRFIQDYQSEFGTPPGPYAVEAWDAAHMLIGALELDGPSGDGLLARLTSTQRVDGLGTYAFVEGELAQPADAVLVYRVEGGRWTAVEGIANP